MFRGATNKGAIKMQWLLGFIALSAFALVTGILQARKKDNED